MYERLRRKTLCSRGSRSRPVAFHGVMWISRMSLEAAEAAFTPQRNARQRVVPNGAGSGLKLRLHRSRLRYVPGGAVRSGVNTA